ncbi:replication protein P [Cedecea sp.]|uniref:replication protein P n=1 Tax=Cedecea sp. TaxID=1970739 RepID=UPI002F3F6E82
MNKLISAVQERDAGALAQIAVDAHREPVVNDNAVKLVDALFDNLIRLFPAARHTVLATPGDVVAMKRQWILAFAENNITTVEQVRAGVRMARRQDSDFWPSCGKFIGWCREGATAGLPSPDEVMAEFERFGATRDLYGTAAEFPWSHPVMYWIIMDMRQKMYRYQQTTSETKKTAQHQLNLWAQKIARGEKIPSPVSQLPDNRRPPSVIQEKNRDPDGRYQRRGTEMLERIRARQKQEG